MEFIVGTTIGRARLAVGIAALFSTCLQAWDFVDAGISYAQNFSLLRTKLDNQRMLVEIWAAALGFDSSAAYDARLDDPEIRPTIEANLYYIIRVFSATERAWTDRYATGELIFHGTREDEFCNTTSSE